MKLTNAFAVGVAAIALVTVSAAGMTAPASASATAAPTATAPVTNEINHGVRMLVRNHTTTDLKVWNRAKGADSVQTLKAGGIVVFADRFMFGADDLELGVMKAGPWTQETLFELDGSNPKMSYPTLSVTHLPTKHNDMRFFKVHEGHYMVAKKVWVKRFDDGDNFVKQFDVDIKGL